MFMGVLLILGALFFAGLFIGAKCKRKTVGLTLIGVFLLLLLMFLFGDQGMRTIEEVRRFGWSAIAHQARDFLGAFALFMSPLILGVAMGRSARRRLKID